MTKRKLKPVTINAQISWVSSLLRDYSGAHNRSDLVDVIANAEAVLKTLREVAAGTPVSAHVHTKPDTYRPPARMPPSASYSILEQVESVIKGLYLVVPKAEIYEGDGSDKPQKYRAVGTLPALRGMGVGPMTNVSHFAPHLLDVQKVVTERFMNINHTQVFEPTSIGTGVCDIRLVFELEAHKHLELSFRWECKASYIGRQLGEAYKTFWYVMKRRTVRIPKAK
jgi:hypothetical protein